jgi:hypothetical protein
MRNNIQYLTKIDEFQKHDGVRNRKFYNCRCICGKLCEVRDMDFKRNSKVSCGCLTNSLIKQSLIKEIPQNTIFGFLSVIKRTDEKSTEGYKYECLCSCGSIILVYGNRLKRGETKSCGCSSAKLNSLSNGGTGVPYETTTVRLAIRQCPAYRRFVDKCLQRANGKSELSGQLSKTLCVHHLDSVATLIENNNLTRTTFLTCIELFSLDNAIVLTEEEHREFHKKYNRKCTKADWETYKQISN